MTLRFRSTTAEVLVYATGYIGVNPNTKLPRKGGGPTFSWRIHSHDQRVL